jgi:hypothetical protein
MMKDFSSVKEFAGFPEHDAPASSPTSRSDFASSLATTHHLPFKDLENPGALCEQMLWRHDMTVNPLKRPEKEKGPD